MNHSELPLFKNLEPQMTFDEFSKLVGETPDGVVLLEGRRAISALEAARARALARHLAISFPRLMFRSGNAEGADQSFTEGIAAIDPSRLQIIAPYAGHRQKDRYAGATYDSPQSLTQVQEAEIVGKTALATPKNVRLLEKRGEKGPLGAKADYLIRDTMKVVGCGERFPKPVFALFYVDLDDPSAGGTGHTIRVCQQEGVPYVFQDAWRQWVEE